MSDQSKPETKPTNQKWYPVRSDFPSHEQWDAHVQTLQSLYALHDKVDAMSMKSENTPQPKPQEFPNQAHNSKIAGLNVSGNVPANGQQLTYDAATGTIIWM